MRSRITARVGAFVGVSALLLALQGAAATTAHAVVGFIPDLPYGIPLTVVGEPVALIGDAGFSCAVGANIDKPAHLSGPLTFTYALPPTTAELRIWVGFNLGFAIDEKPPSASTIVPTDGKASPTDTGFTCRDALPNGLFQVQLSASDSTGFILAQDIGYIQLSNVD